MKKRLCIRLMAVVTSLVCAFALLSFAQVHAFAEDDAELPYEIRATIITSEKLSDLELADDWSPWITFNLSDNSRTRILAQKKLNSRVYRYDVIYTVPSSTLGDYTLGSPSKFKLRTKQYLLSDVVKAKVQKDDSKNVLYSDFTFRESFSLEYPVKLVDADTKQAITIAPPLKDIELLLGDTPQLLNIVSDGKSGLKLSYDAALDDTGKLPQLALDQSGSQKVYKFGEKYYQCTSVKTIQDANGSYISLALRDITKNMKTIHVVLERPFFLGALEGQAYANFRVSSSMGFQDKALHVQAGTDPIPFDVTLPCAEDEPQLDVQLIPAKKDGPRAWMDTVFLAKGSYDASAKPYITYATRFLRELLLNITPVDGSMTMEGFDKAKSLEGLSATLKDNDGKSVSGVSFTRETIPTKTYSSLPYHLRGLLPGTYTLQFSSTDENVQKTYDLSTVYKLSLDKDGFIKTSHLGDDQQTLYYPAGTKTRPNTPAESYMFGSVTAVNIALAHRPTVEKRVRIAKDDKAQFMQKVTANTGDTVQFDIAVTLPRDYNLIWQCTIPNSFTRDIAGHARALQLNDVIDSHLSLVEGSTEVLDSKFQPIKKEDMSCVCDKDNHTLTLTDKRPSKVQQIPTSGDHAFTLALRDAEETIHLRFKAKVTGFGTSNEIKNTVEGSTATIYPYEKLTAKTLWQDANGNELAQPPSSIYVQLLANGTPQGNPVMLNKDGKWQYEFTNLPSKDKDGKAIAYTVAELTKKDGEIVQEQGTLTVDNQKFVAGYARKDNVVTITNKQVPVPEPPAPKPEPTPEPPAPPTPQPAPMPEPSLPLSQPPLQIPAASLVPAETLQTPAVTLAPKPAPAPAAPEPALPQTGDECAPAALLGSVAAFLSISFCALGLVFSARPRARG